MAIEKDTDRDHALAVDRRAEAAPADGTLSRPISGDGSGVSLPPLQVGDAAVQRKAQVKGDPTFTLRAQDQLAPIVVEYWCDLARAAGVSEAKVEEARQKARTMRDWQARNAAKVPD